MGVWIRSQNKMALINCEKFEINLENDCYEILANSGIDETYDYIGGYQSKEQALRVLDLLEGYIEDAESGVYDRPFKMPRIEEI